MPQRLLRRLFPHQPHHLDGFHDQVRNGLPRWGRLLDLGCGDQEEMDRYRTPQRHVWGADFHAHPRLQHANWFRLLGSDGRIPFPDNFFDVVASLWVLEHVADPAFFLGEVARVLKPGGRFIGHTVSGRHYVTWIRRLLGLLPHRWNQRLVRRLYGRDECDTFPAFYRINDDHALHAAARQTGLQLARIERYADPGYFRFARPLLHLAMWTDWFLSRLKASWGQLYFTVIMQKPALATAATPEIDENALDRNRAFGHLLEPLVVSSDQGGSMFYYTEAKPQSWRAVAIFDDRPDQLLYLNRSNTQVRAGYRAVYMDLLDDEEREHVRSISLQHWQGAPDSGRWIHQANLIVPNHERVAQVA